MSQQQVDAEQAANVSRQQAYLGSVGYAQSQRELDARAAGPAPPVPTIVRRTGDGPDLQVCQDSAHR
jgi:hypothetical protein